MFAPFTIPTRPAKSATPAAAPGASPEASGEASQGAAPAPSRVRTAAQAAAITQLRERIARIERSHGGSTARFLPLGIPAIDQALPGGGIALGALHEAASAGADTEHAAAA